MKKQKQRWCVTLGLVALLTALYYNCAFDTEDWTVTLPRLPESCDGMRITLLTDLHGVEFGQGNQRLLKAVRNSHPDLIAISGDLIDESTNLDIMPALLSGLTDIAPTYFVPGNHEWIREDTKDLLKTIADYGVTVLRNRVVPLNEEGTLILGGSDDRTSHIGYQTPQELTTALRAKIAPDACLIMLSHRNNELSLWSQTDTDLVLSGHGHGGVIRLPFIGGLLSVDRTFFPKDCEGLYEENGTTLAVSRGLGGIRLWNPPHLPTIVLRKP